MKTRRKVLFITYFAANEPLLDSRTTPVLREMSKKGIEYHLVTFEKKNTGNMLFMGRRKLIDKFKEIGVKWSPLSYHKRPLILATFYDICVGLIYSLFIIVVDKIDYIHAQTSVGGAIALPIAKLFRKKFIYDINGLLAEEYADAGIWNRNSIVFKIVNYFEKCIIYHADGIIPLSERFAEKIKEGKYIPYKKPYWNYQVIPSHVDMERFRAGGLRNSNLKNRHNLNGKFILIYVGSVGTWYMLSEMLDFFSAMKKIIQNAVFLILSHTDKDMIKQELYKKGLGEEDIVITEALPEDVSLYLSIADAGIFFIKPVFSKEACSPIKLGEYLAARLPVFINAKVGDTEELIRNTRTGVVVTKFEKKWYEKAILELKNLVDVDKELKERCFKTAQTCLSLDAAMERYQFLYNDTFGIL